MIKGISLLLAILVLPCGASQRLAGKRTNRGFCLVDGKDLFLNDVPTENKRLSISLPSDGSSGILIVTSPRPASA